MPQTPSTAGGVFVRVCVPAYNEEKYIGACLAALNRQSYPRELYDVVVVVDSETSDDTAAIARELQAQVLVERRYHTIGGACRIGFEGSNADIFAGTQADTEVPVHWLERIVRDFGRDAETVGVTGPVQVRRECGLIPHLGFRAMNITYRVLGSLRRTAYFHGANYAYRRDAYHRAGGFSTHLAGGEDNDLSMRVSALPGKVCFDRDLAVLTSDRRLRQGYLSCVWQYGKLFVQINRARQPQRFEHYR